MEDSTDKKELQDFWFSEQQNQLVAETNGRFNKSHTINKFKGRVYSEAIPRGSRKSHWPDAEFLGTGEMFKDTNHKTANPLP